MKYSAILPALFLPIAGLLPLRAATWTWAGGATGDWSQPGNWQEGTVPAADAATRLRFLRHPGQTMSQDLNGFYLNSMEFGPEAGDYLLLGQSLEFVPAPGPAFVSPELKYVSSGDAEIRTDILLGDRLDIHGADGPGLLTLSGTLEGSGGIRLDRDPTSLTVLDGPVVRYTGDTVLERGTLVFKSTRNAPAGWSILSPQARLSVEGNGTLTLTNQSITGGGATGIRGNLDIAGGSLTVNGAGTVGTPGTDDLLLRLQSGTLGGDLAAVHATFEWSGGTLAATAGSGTAFFSPVSLTGSATKFLGRNVVSGHAVTWDGGNVSAAAGTMWEHAGPLPFQITAGSEWQSGSFRVRPGRTAELSGPGQTSFTGPVFNDGSFGVAASLRLAGGGTHGGTFNVQPAGSLLLEGAAHSFSATGALQGAAGSGITARNTTLSFSAPGASLTGDTTVLMENVNAGGPGSFEWSGGGDLTLRGSTLTGSPGELAILSGTGTARFENLNFTPCRVDRDLETRRPVQMAHSALTLAAGVMWRAGNGGAGEVNLNSAAISGGAGSELRLESPLTASGGTSTISVPVHVPEAPAGQAGIIAQNATLQLMSGAVFHAPLHADNGTITLNPPAEYRFPGGGFRRAAVTLARQSTLEFPLSWPLVLPVITFDPEGGGELSIEGDGSGNVFRLADAELKIRETLRVEEPMETRQKVTISAGLTSPGRSPAKLDAADLTFNGSLALQPDALQPSPVLELGRAGGSIRFNGSIGITGLAVFIQSSIAGGDVMTLHAGSSVVVSGSAADPFATIEGPGSLVATTAWDQVRPLDCNAPVTFQQGFAFHPGPQGPVGVQYTRFRQPVTVFYQNGAVGQEIASTGEIRFENTRLNGFFSAQGTPRTGIPPLRVTGGDADNTDDFIFDRSTFEMHGGISGGTADFALWGGSIAAIENGIIDVSHFNCDGGQIRRYAPSGPAPAVTVNSPAGSRIGGAGLTVDNCNAALNSHCLWSEGTIGLQVEDQPGTAGSRLHVQEITAASQGWVSISPVGGLPAVSDPMSFSAGKFTRSNGGLQLQVPFSIGELDGIGALVDTHAPGTVQETDISSGSLRLLNTYTCGATVRIRGGLLTGGATPDQAAAGIPVGVVGGAVSIEDHGTLELNHGSRPLLCGNSLTLKEGAHLVVHLSDWNATASTGAAGAVTGTLVLDAAAPAIEHVTVCPVSPPAGFDFQPRTFRLVQAASGLSGAIPSGITFSRGANFPAGGQWSLSMQGTDLLLHYTADPYWTWIQSKGLTGSPAAFTADPDNDGYSNGIEFILDGNPTTAERAGSPVLPVLTPMGGNVGARFSFRRRDDAAYLTLWVRYSTNLSDWHVISPHTLHSADDAAGPGLDLITAEISGPGTRVFAKLSVGFL